MKLLDTNIFLRALDLWATSPRLDFDDALLVAHAQRQGDAALYSCDTDFDAIPGITRHEPQP